MTHSIWYKNVVRKKLTTKKVKTVRKGLKVKDSIPKNLYVHNELRNVECGRSNVLAFG